MQSEVRGALNGTKCLRNKGEMISWCQRALPEQVGMDESRKGGRVGAAQLGQVGRFPRCGLGHHSDANS